MPINGIETAYKDRYTFAPPSKRQIKAGSVVHFASAIYITTERSNFPSNEFAGFSRIGSQPIRETSIPCFACEDRRCYAFLQISMLQNESVLPEPNRHVWLLVPLHNLF
jgi:hypothetical protein